MAKRFEYTTLAHRYTARFPVLTYVGTQTNFWILANIFLIVIMNLQSRLVSDIYGIPVATRLGSLIFAGVILGVLYGVILGLTGYYWDRSTFRKQALGKVIVFKTLTSLAVLMLVLGLLRYVFFDTLIAPSMRVPGLTLSGQSWRSIFFLLATYYLVMTLIISFINQVNTKYGPGVLLPLLLGRYREPKEEDRIFMFMDLKSSTATAEKLGHLKYSAFIRDCFSDINEVLYPYRAQVYQYVGDEIVVTWAEHEGVKNHFCIGFYFACRRQFNIRSEYYTRKYGFLPDFKAGAHTGTVSTVEIGEVKRDIAYHGDTLNTAARIQSICNEHDKHLLISTFLLDKLGTHPDISTADLGMILLKGKSTRVGIISVEDWKEMPAAPH